MARSFAEFYTRRQHRLMVPVEIIRVQKECHAPACGATDGFSHRQEKPGSMRTLGRHLNPALGPSQRRIFDKFKSEFLSEPRYRFIIVAHEKRDRRDHHFSGP